MTDNTISLQEYRAKVRAIGYKMTVATHSDFKAVKMYANDKGERFNASSSIVTPAAALAHSRLLELRKEYKGRVSDGLFRVVI